MERRSGEAVEAVANISMQKAAEEAKVAEMNDIHAAEEKIAQKSMIDMDTDLGVGILDPNDSARYFIFIPLI